MVSTIEKIANACKTGHIESIFQYDLNHWKVQCYCERCGTVYERTFTREESERFREELTTPMTI